MDDNAKTSAKTQLLTTVTSCASKAEGATIAIEALQFSQAALNAAHALSCLHIDVKE